MFKLTSSITAKDKFNALSNATHIFAFKENQTPIKLVELIITEDGAKGVVVDGDGVLHGLFTDSRSATSCLSDIVNVFEDDQPFFIVNIRETAKKQSVYFLEVQ